MVAMGALGMQAESMYLHITQKDGTVKVVDLDTIDRLVFNNGSMTALKGDQTVTEVEVAGVEKMGFYEDDDPAVGIKTVKTTDDAFALDRSGILTIGATTATVLRVYDLQGAEVVSVPGLKTGMKVDLSSLKGGIYVISMGSKTAKITVR
ncbi:MAG: T9SS type A sorting domain-containing protein [Bacteroidales bacterium]|nr:T9SS type A sorting domain-containing protein [Bacteroidales bacterium]